jgi:hypothetical protein
MHLQDFAELERLVYIHHMSMAAPSNECTDAPSEHQTACKISYIDHQYTTAALYECVDAPSSNLAD